MSRNSPMLNKSNSLCHFGQEVVFHRFGDADGGKVAYVQ